MARKQPGVTGESDGNDATRRSVLRGLAGAGAGLAGVSVAAGSAGATESLLEALECLAGWEDAPRGYPTVDTYDGGLTTSNVPTGVPEVTFFCHGWGADRETGLDNAYTFDVAAGLNGYDEPVVGIIWDAQSLDWYGSKDRVEAAGARFAEWLVGYAAGNPDTTINLAGHSLGGRFVVAALNALDGRVVLDNAVLLGAAIDNDDVCGDGRWAPGIGTSARSVYNFHSWDDEVVGEIYSVAEWTYAAGHSGADCGWWDGDPPSNYHDVDRTWTVDAHCDYHKPHVGCMPGVASVLG